MARRIRYSVAMSLDGYIAGPKGEADWIVMDPTFDFSAMMSQFDTMLLGRRTFEPMARVKRTENPGMKTIVVSTTMSQKDYPGITVIGSNAEKEITRLRKAPGKDIWLFGGGELFRRLLDAGLVDSVEVAIVPVLLGAGIPLLQPPFRQAKLRLAGHQVYPTGIVTLQYDVVS
jgi:dihydrofolate reductase